MIGRHGGRSAREMPLGPIVSGMAGHLSNEDLDDLEVAFARVEHTLQLLDDEQVDPLRSVEWLDDAVAAPRAQPVVSGAEDAGPTLAPVVAFPKRTMTD